MNKKLVALLCLLAIPVLGSDYWPALLVNPTNGVIISPTTNLVLLLSGNTSTNSDAVITYGIMTNYVSTVMPTNGAVSTNGLASTNWVTSQGYVTASITNGLASTNWVNSQNFVTKVVTNGLATTNFVTSQGYLTASTLPPNDVTTTNMTNSVSFNAGIVSPFFQFDTSYTNGVMEGKLQWNGDHGGPEVGMPGGTVNLQLGFEHLVWVKNMTGATIKNGQVVAFVPANGAGRVGVILCKSNVGGITNIVDGLATEDIGAGDSGFVCGMGLSRDLNTLGLAEGIQVYSSTNSGGITAIRPTYPIDARVVGTVAIVDETEGAIYVKPQASEKLWSELDAQYLSLSATNRFATTNFVNNAISSISMSDGSIFYSVWTGPTNTLYIISQNRQYTNLIMKTIN